MSASQPTLTVLRERLALVRHADRPRLERELGRLNAARAPDAEALRTLEARISASADEVERLRGLPLALNYDPALPIAAHREEIARSLAIHPLIVVCGATGSGKTTQLPKICMEAGRGAFGLIGHTQPRRIAARALANRLASELGTQVGGGVGYQVRFTERVGADCRVKLMTDGILLRELERDRLLRRYDTLIIDEAHERSLNVDFLLGIIKHLLPRRPELRVVVTSATIDPQRFAQFFGGAPVIEVSGRSYPVEVRYRPLAGAEDEAELSVGEGVVAAVRDLDRTDRGDVLVFLPGEKQIRETAEALGKARLHHTEVLPLYARLSTRDQERVFEPHAPRRIVLATNVAETSLTVPGIRHVIDSGLARISRYSVRGKVQRLPIEPISQASAEQRKGRAGRERPGICVRLYAEDEFALRPAFTPPEVQRTSLASVILQMAALELGEPQDFPFVDPPDTRAINDGYRLLQELKAVDAERRVTALGRQIAMLPLDPRLARMLIAASHHRCVTEMLTIASFLAAQDPRERPSDAQAQADEAHAAFADPRSDFIAVLNLWKAFEEQGATLSGSQLRKWCRGRFLSFMRLREWHELRRQLAQVARELELRANEQPAEYADLHQAILSGFLGNLGMLDEPAQVAAAKGALRIKERRGPRREYEGARGSRFVIAPGTPLASRPPKWIVAASLIETARLYARMVAAIEPEWIESAAAHLLKRSFSEPHWVEERGFVAAYESTALYGLTLTARRRVNYAAVAPQAAREIFVREALAEGRTRFRAAFLDHNRRLRHEVETLEAKIRRRDIVVDEQGICDFYLARLPEHVHSVAALQKWLGGTAGRGGRHERPADSAAHDRALFMTHADLLRRHAAEITPASYPDSLRVGENELPLAYRFEPGASDDGLSLTLPAPLIEPVMPADFSWPVPGWRVEAITELLRALPKHLRKAFVPVPEHAARAAREIEEGERDFYAALAGWIQRTAGVSIRASELSALELPAHLRLNFRVVDLEGRLVAESRDLAALKLRLSAAGRERPAPARELQHRRWQFGELPVERAVERRGLRFTVFPTLRDTGEAVEVTEAGTREEADSMLGDAVLRLAMLSLPEQLKYARKRFAEERELVLLGRSVSGSRPLADAFAQRCFVECFLEADGALPRSAAQFDALLDSRRGQFGDLVDRTLKHVTEVLRELHGARQKLATLSAPAFESLQQDAQAQLQRLVGEDFPASVPQLLWPHLPRYLRALARRLDKAAGNARRDADIAARLRPASRAYADLMAKPHPRARRAELEHLGWMIEELRVSLFAQDLKTVIPVSEKRVEEQVRKVTQ